MRKILFSPHSKCKRYLSNFIRGNIQEDVAELERQVSKILPIIQRTRNKMN